MPKSEAAVALGLSPLVLSRQIAVGRFRTKTISGKILVDVEEREHPTDTITEDEPHREVDTVSCLPEDTESPPESENEAVNYLDHHPVDVETLDAGAGECAHDPASKADAYDSEVYTAAIDTVQRVRAYCDRESGMARDEADRAWATCERAERRLRAVSVVAAGMLLVALISVAWLDRIHQRELQAWEAKVGELEVAATTSAVRDDGEAEGIRDAFATYRENADAERADLHTQLMDAKTELAASRVEIDHACWERDEAMRDRDRLANEVASQRDHIEKMQSLQVGTAARSLKNLLDESWDLTPPPETLPTADPVSGDRSTVNPQLSSRR